MRTLALIFAALLTGCAQQLPPNPSAQPNCTEYRGERCIAWVFGPTRTQREAFDRRSQR